MELSQIHLQGGPYHDTVMTDMGTDVIGKTIGKTVDGELLIGTAWYEPSPDRKLAFWLDNEWLPTNETTEI